jgi:hypothetical protein
LFQVSNANIYINGSRQCAVPGMCPQ